MLKLATKFNPQVPAFEAAHRAGFRNAEIWTNAALLFEAAGLLERARHYPFGYAIHFPNQLDLPANALRGLVDLYRGLPASCIVIHQPHFDRHAAELERLEPGIRLAIENHRLTPEDFHAWAERSPGLTLDVEHLWMLTLRGAGLDVFLGEVRKLLERWAPKLLHVHMPGYWPGLREHRPMYCARDMVFPVLSLLQEFDFRGLIVSEADAEYQNDAELRMDVLLFETWRRRHDPLLQTRQP